MELRSVGAKSSVSEVDDRAQERDDALLGPLALVLVDLKHKDSFNRHTRPGTCNKDCYGFTVDTIHWIVIDDSGKTAP